MKISVLILTLNEEKHIARCILSVKPFADEVFLVDSGSTDRTVAIANELGASVLVNPWKNYATQFNWGLDHASMTGDWVMRMDADEYVTPELAQEIKTVVKAASGSVTGFYVTRRVHFMGRWIKRGGYYPIRLLRLWRRGSGRCEERWMDEHMVLPPGETPLLHGDVVDENLNNLTWWTNKHNAYATREAIDLLNIRYGFAAYTGISADDMGKQESRKRWLKERVYARLPPGMRAAMYFLYRYVALGGFLDGRPGFVFHVLQGFWYRFLVDAKIYEVERLMRSTGRSAAEVLQQDFGIRLEG